MLDTISALPTSAPSSTETSDVVSRLLNETPIGMTTATKFFGPFRDGKAKHANTISRWAIKGITLARIIHQSQRELFDDGFSFGVDPYGPKFGDESVVPPYPQSFFALSGLQPV